MNLELELIAISHISRLCAFQLNLAVFTKRMSRNFFLKQDPISNQQFEVKRTRNVHHQTGRYHVGTKYDFCQKKS